MRGVLMESYLLIKGTLSHNVAFFSRYFFFFFLFPTPFQHFILMLIFLFFPLIFSLLLTIFSRISLLISSGISLSILFSSLERPSFYRFKQNQEVTKPFTIFMVVFPNVGCYERFPPSLPLKVVVSGFPLFSIK